MTQHKILSSVSAGLLGAMLGAVVTPLHAAPGTVSAIPLFVGNSVQPNVLLPIDTSGSMDAETLFITNDGALWWNTGQQRFDDGAGNLNYNDSGSRNDTWKKYIYLFPNGQSGNYDARRIYDDGDNWNAIPPTLNYAYARSPDYNSAYYNPTVRYSPWLSYGVDVGTDAFLDADPSDARYDPIDGSTRKLDLLSTVADADADDDQHTFRMFKGMVIPKDTRYKYLSGGGWVGAADDTVVQAAGANTDYEDVAIPYHPATYYLAIKQGNYSVKDAADNLVFGDCANPDPAHYGHFHDKPSTFSSGNSDAVALGPDGVCLKEVVIDANSAEKQNFANWFTYYRRRHLAMRGSVVRAFEDIDGIRAKAFSIENRSGDLTMLNMDNAGDRNTFYGDVYGLHTTGGGTPNREALDYAGTQLMRSDANAPITDECQKNFTVLFTDGFSVPNTGSGVGNADGDDDSDFDGVAPYADDHSNTIADIAMHYYETNLRSALLPHGEVPVVAGCNVADPDAKLDCNRDLHMNTYGVVLNAPGKDFFGKTHDEVADAYTNPPAWENPTADRSPVQVDDLYHACVNGRGEMFNADTPAEIEAALSTALADVAQETGAASAIALNTTQLDNTTTLFQARFNTEYWGGELLARDIDENTGAIAANPTWDASEQVPAAADRVIITYNPSLDIDGVDGGDAGKGVAFNTAADDDDLSNSDLSATAQSDLGANLPAGLTARDRLDYLRGSRDHEAAGEFRIRDADTVLGDIVHSTPVFVGDPEQNWPSEAPFPTGASSYATFKAGSATNRTDIVYVGANDGMLHGFRVSDGVEQLAYIPHRLYSAAANAGLHHLSEQTYGHRYYVDLTPTVADAYTKGREINGTVDATVEWRTILVGGLRAGGPGLFALDVTDPTDFDENSAARVALWEFTNADDADLGLTFAKPTIVPTHATSGSNLRWAAIVGNGYNSGDAGGDCHAKLFILFLDGGLDGDWSDAGDYIEIDTEVGSAGNCNGLSAPSVVDLDSDGIADRVYAGDLHGNLWAFDLCNADGDGNCQGSGWGVAYDSGSPDPLFTGVDASGDPQPITTQPRIVKHPDIADVPGTNDPNVLVLFGTGQYLSSTNQNSVSDVEDTTITNSFYAVWDEGSASLDRDDLQQQTFSTVNLDLDGDSFNDTAVRLMSDEEVKYDGSGGNKEWGWYVDLTESGSGNERVIVDPKVRGDIVFFNTAVPTASGCDVGGESWLMSVSLETGGEPQRPVFDVNNDGLINESDLVNDAPPGGIKEESGIASSPTFAGDYRLIQYSDGEAESDRVKPTGVQNIGRYSWEELRRD